MIITRHTVQLNPSKMVVEIYSRLTDRAVTYVLSISEYLKIDQGLEKEYDCILFTS